MNNVSLIGRLTADPDHHVYDRDGAQHSFARFRLAVDRANRDGTDFFDVVAFEATADAVCAHVAKGRKVGVNGRLETTQWEDTAGQHHTGFQIRAAQIDFLEKPRT